MTTHDDSNAPLVVIVNQSMARDCWLGQSAIGKRMHVGNPQKALPWATVVGVVADTNMPRDTPSIDQWYTPMNQPATLYGSGTPGNLSGPPSGYITMRSALDPEHMIQTLRSTVAEIDPLLALQEVRPVTEAISAIEAPRHFNTDLITAFAAVLWGASAFAQPVPIPPAAADKSAGKSTPATADDICRALEEDAAENELPVEFFARVIWQASRSWCLFLARNSRSWDAVSVCLARWPHHDWSVPSCLLSARPTLSST